MTTVALLSDIHMRSSCVDEIAEALHKIQAELNSDTIAHTFVLGDLIEDDTKQRDIEHVRKVKSILDNFPSPVTYLLGNHDLGNLSRNELSETLDQNGFYGKTSVDSQQIVHLDSAVKGGGARGALGSEQRQWIRNSVNQDAILLCHHPFGNFSLTENYWFRNYPERAYLWDRKECLQQFDMPPIVTISGHIHQTGQNQFHDLTHWSLNAVSKEHPNKPISGTYALLDLESPMELTVKRAGNAIESLSLTS